MYIFEDKASNAYEEFSDNYINAHLRGSSNLYFSHTCQATFTTHPLEIDELDKKFDNALSNSCITELSISVTYDVVFDDQRPSMFNEYMDIDPIEFAYAYSDVIDVEITSFVRNGESYNYDYTYLLGEIVDYLAMVCHSSAIINSVFTRRFASTPTLTPKYTF